jgi:hypothetical protein
MMSAANQDATGAPNWNQGPWGDTRGRQREQSSTGNRHSTNPYWAGPPFWHPEGISRPAAIAFTVLGFIFWWPVGLALLIYMLGTHGMFRRPSSRDVSAVRPGRRPLGPLEDVGLRSLGATRCHIRQPRLRRIQGRDAAAHGGGAEGIRLVPGAFAVRERQSGIRSIHGGAAGSAVGAHIG